MVQQCTGICDPGSDRTAASYERRTQNRLLESSNGCTWDVQLHAAVVELSAAKGAEIKYSTVQNWYAGDADGNGGIFNFVTKRGLCDGDNSKISWTQVWFWCPYLLSGIRRKTVKPGLQLELCLCSRGGGGVLHVQP